MSSMSRGIMSDVEWRSPAGRLIVGAFLIALLIASIVVLFPYFFSFTAGLKTSTEIFKPGLHLLPEEAMWKNYSDAWKRFSMIRIFKNSFIAAGGGVIGQLVVSSLAGFSLSRLNPKGKKVIQAIILITMAIPGIAYLVPRYVMMSDFPVIHVSLINNWWGIWIPYAASSFMILILKNAFDAIPRDIFDAAQVDGASEPRMFASIALPLTSSLILVLGILAFIGLWGDFLWPLLILRNEAMQTVPVRLYNLTRSFPVNLFLAGSFIAMLPPTIAALFLQRYVKGGLTI
ncbi:MAG: carbohydrate ABC transporter permease [Chloroflexota bacterium]|nr:MAG: carbohydrate ABC transporter permease [Chloroflexota bacterium]